MRDPQFSRQAEKMMAKLFKRQPELAKDLVDAIENLCEDPTQGHVKRLTNAPDYRVKTGNYRIIYNFSDELVEILVIDHRRDAYKKYKRLYT